MKKLQLSLALLLGIISVTLAIIETVTVPSVIGRLILGSTERLTLGGACVCLMLWADYASLLKPPRRCDITVLISALAVSLANFPFFTLAEGELTFTNSPAIISAYILYCFSVGAFEETVFRGLLLMALFDYFTKKNRTRPDILALITSSAVFALFHLFNILSGASVGATLLQVGYTLLTGGMFGAVVLTTHSVYPAILIHMLYNIGGTCVTMQVAQGANWNTPSAILMAIVSVLATVTITLRIIMRKSEIKTINQSSSDG